MFSRSTIGQKVVFLVLLLFCLSLLPTSSPAQAWLLNNPATPSLEMGQPGLSFRRTATLGIEQMPYITDTSHFNAPSSVYVDGNDNLYVTETLGFRILRFDAAGANTLEIGTPGDYWLQNPADSVVDSNGHIWTVMPHSVRQFDPDGNFLQSLPDQDHFWESGQTNDRFDLPSGLALDSTGRLYVADSNNHRIQVYEFITSTLSYSTTIGQTGVPGTTPGLFNRPIRLAFDSSDRLYVADTNNHRIQRCAYGSGWTCEDFFGESGVPQNDDTHLSSPWGVTVRGNKVFIADSANFRILECDLSANCTFFAGTPGEQGSDNAHFGWPSDAAVDSSGNVFVTDQDVNHRIQVFDANRSYIETRGVTGVPYLTTPDYFNEPSTVFIGEDGSLYMVELYGLRMLKFDPAGAFAWSYGTPGVFGDSEGYMSNWWTSPQGKVAVSSEGNVYLPDTANHRILILDDTDGSLVDQMGITREGGADNLHFSCPAGAAINPLNNDIAIADMCNQRVQVFTSERVYKATLGVPEVSGTDDLHFSTPRDVAFGSDGSLYVADWDNFRVQKCTYTTGTNYTCATFAGETGVFTDDFAHLRPIGVSLDAEDRLYVADEWLSRVQVFDDTGAYLTTIAGANGLSAHEMGAPYGLAVGPDGSVYVADRFNMRVEVYSPGYPDWVQVNINGFGDRWNTNIPSMEIFDNALYVGVGNWSGTGVEVWRTFDGTTWEQSGDSGFNQLDPDPNAAVIDLAVFGTNLYASTGWLNLPGQIWRTADGVTWTRVEDDGFGDPGNQGINIFGNFDNQIYVGTQGSDGVEIWRSESGDADSWTRVVENGNGDNTNNFITDLLEFNGDFYAVIESTADPKTGLQIWQSTDGSGWTAVVDDGFGNSENFQTGGATVFNGMLYVGTRNDATGAELWRSPDGLIWEPVVGGGAPIPSSFGNPDTEKFEQIFVFNEKLYASLFNTVDGLQLWRSDDGDTWEPFMTDGFGNPHSSWTGWTGLKFKDMLFLAVGDWSNASGIKIWAYDPFPDTLYLPLIVR